MTVGAELLVSGDRSLDVRRLACLDGRAHGGMEEPAADHVQHAGILELPLHARPKPGHNEPDLVTLKVLRDVHKSVRPVASTWVIASASRTSQPGRQHAEHDPAARRDAGDRNLDRIDHALPLPAVAYALFGSSRRMPSPTGSQAPQRSDRQRRRAGRSGHGGAAASR
jgi:hypothetical protein